MSLAVLIPYRPDTERRRAIHECALGLWGRQQPELPVELCVSGDGLDGLFSYSRAANRARAMTDADYLLLYNTDALPLPPRALIVIEEMLKAGIPWTAVFEGQQRFTQEQTLLLLGGVDPSAVGPAQGEISIGREALIGIRADVWDELRGMDERFVGWGPEDHAFYGILKALYPGGNDRPMFGYFQALHHPETPKTAWNANVDLWKSYPFDADTEALRDWYLAR